MELCIWNFRIIFFELHRARGEGEGEEERKRESVGKINFSFFDEV